VLQWGTLAILLLGAIGLFLGLEQAGLTPAGKTANHWYDIRSQEKALIRLPEDDGHHDVPTEWWSYNGQLQSESGGRYNLHFTTTALSFPIPQTVVQASLIDLKTQRRYLVQRAFPGNPSKGIKDRFDFVLGEWLMSGTDGKDHIRLSTEEFGFDLRLTTQAPPLLHGGSGRLDLNVAGNLFYYSRPRMEASGQIWVASKRVQVAGQVWFDHQWGEFRVAGMGWSWFALQLEDGADIMLYRMFDKNHHPLLSTGTYWKDGVTQVLDTADFDAKPLSRWESPSTAIAYPLRWRIEIPGKALSLELEPLVENSELDGRQTRYRVSWEGPVQVRGTVAGRGFLGLTGYGQGPNE
jgi:predicted secreted hydrolase